MISKPNRFKALSKPKLYLSGECIQNVLAIGRLKTIKTIHIPANIYIPFKTKAIPEKNNTYTDTHKMHIRFSECSLILSLNLSNDYLYQVYFYSYCLI